MKSYSSYKDSGVRMDWRDSDVIGVKTIEVFLMSVEELQKGEKFKV